MIPSTKIDLNNGSQPANPRPGWKSGGKVLRLLGRAIWIAAAVGLGVGLGHIASGLVPLNFKATTQLLIDPHGLRVFSNDLSPGTFDANAAINFVESQLGVIKSDRVLLRVVRNELAAVDGRSPVPDNFDDLEQPEGPATPPAPTISAEEEMRESRALSALKRSVSVTRAERSYIVEVSVENRDPEIAARQANGIAQAYRGEDTWARNLSTRRLAADLDNRVSTLRETLRQSEAKVDNYRLENNLLGDQEKLLMQQLASLLSRRDVSTGEAAQLSATFGESFPTLVGVREKGRLLVAEVEQKKTEIVKARKAEVELRMIERETQSHRSILEAFETRAREAREFGRIDASNIRVISPARAPFGQQLDRNPKVWAFFGGLLGLVLAVFVIVLFALAGTFRSSSKENW